MTSAWTRRFALLVACSVLSARPASAADAASATIAITLAAPAGETAVVEISAEPDRGPRWTASISGGRRHTFQGVVPGPYVLEVVLGSQSPARSVVTVRPGDAVVLEIAPAGSLPPRVTVVAQHRQDQGVQFGPGELENLPFGNSLWGLVDAAAPFVISDRIDNGGLATGSWARLGSRGSSWMTTKIYAGDVELDSPNVRGAMTLYPDLSAFEGVTLLSGLTDPGVATPGTAIALTPRRPGRERRLTIDGGFTSPGMVASGAGRAPEIGRVHDWQEGGLRWDGPITSRIGAVLSASVTNAATRVRDAAPIFSSRVASFMTHVVASPNDRDELRLLAWGQQIARPFDGAPLRAGADERDRFFGATLAWERRTAGGGTRELSIGANGFGLTPDAAAAAMTTVDRTDGPVPAPATRETARTITARGAFAPAGWHAFGLDHALHAGIDLRRTDTSAGALGASAIAEMVAGLPARVWTSTPPAASSSRHVTTAVLTGTDEIAIARRLTFIAGARVEVVSGAASGAARGVRWTSASPLVALRWTPAIFDVTAGYRRYASQLTPSLLAFGDPGEPAVDVARWSDATQDGVFDEDERGVLVARAGRAPSIAGIAGDLHPSHTDEYSLRAERRLGQRHTVRVTATVRHERDVLRSMNTGAPASAYRALSVPNQIDDPNRARDGLLTVYDRLPETFGQDQYVLANAPGEGAHYRGLEIAWEMRSARWLSLAGASAYESSGLGGSRGFHVDENDQGVVGELLENPNAASFAGTRGFFDRAYVFKWSTVYRAPHGIVASFNARYEDGQVFARQVLVPDLAQGPEVVSADYSEATRFTFTATIDARLAKTFTLGGRRMTASVDAFNLTNLDNEVEEYPVSGPDFRISTAIQPRRTVRVGLRFDF
jgi:hypothetical protein